MTEEDAPIVVGEPVPGNDPEDLPDDIWRCGHCADGVLSSPVPERWVPGRMEEGKRERIAVIQSCYSCDLPSVVTYDANVGPDGVARLSRRKQSPPPWPKALGIKEYEGTDIEAYYQEAWRCRRAALRRAALVMARSTLQACFRRYLPPQSRGLYSREMDQVAELAGEGWKAVGKGVRDFGNKWAHPEGTTATPSWDEVGESFDRMQHLLEFTAAMERVSYLKRTPGGDDAS